jgi:hypothetical protein
MSDVGKSATVSRKKRWLSFVITTLLALGLVFVAKPAFAASTYACPNGDSHTPPYNWTDRCVVLTSDRGTNFVGQMTGATDYNATPLIHTERVRVIGDYVSSGRKLLIRSIQIRYVQGSVPWAWYWVHIRDGNGMYYTRAFNNNGIQFCRTMQPRDALRCAGVRFLGFRIIVSPDQDFAGMSAA